MKMRVLLVHHNDGVLLSHQILLKVFFESVSNVEPIVTVTNSPQCALEFANAQDIDIALVGLSFGDCYDQKGLELIRQLRTRCKKAVVILMTFDLHQDIVDAAANCGAHECLIINSGLEKFDALMDRCILRVLNRGEC